MVVSMLCIGPNHGGVHTVCIGPNHGGLHTVHRS